MNTHKIGLISTVMIPELAENNWAERERRGAFEGGGAGLTGVWRERGRSLGREGVGAVGQQRGQVGHVGMLHNGHFVGLEGERDRDRET